MNRCKGGRKTRNYEKPGQHCTCNSYRHMQLAIATNDQPRLEHKGNDPGRHEDSVQEYERHDPLRNRPSAVCLAVKIELLKSHEHDEKHDAGGDEIEDALNAFPAHGSVNCNRDCA